MATAIHNCNFYPLGSNRSFHAHSNQFLVFERRVSHCQLFIFVWRDFSRVFVGGGLMGYDWTAREADEVEIEALAERFDLSELRAVLAQRRNT